MVIGITVQMVIMNSGSVICGDKKNPLAEHFAVRHFNPLYRTAGSKTIYVAPNDKSPRCQDKICPRLYECATLFNEVRA